MTVTTQPGSFVSALTLDTRLADVLLPPAAARLRHAFGVETVSELLQHYPRRHNDRGEVCDVADAADGDKATIQVTVITVREMRMRTRRRFLKMTCTDQTGARVDVSLFSLWQVRKDGIKPGATVLFSGKVSTWHSKAGPVRQMSAPEYVLASDADGFAERIIPIYPATRECPSPWIADQIRLVLACLAPLPDPLPDDIRERRRLVTFDEAVRNLHSPSSLDAAAAARTRLAYDEAFVVQTTLALRRCGHARRVTRPRPGISAPHGSLAAFDQNLPFELTDGQAAAGREIATELSATTPMNRLVLGEVGSGKTVVGLRALLQIVDSGAQGALLAPTEVLAAQHHRSLLELLGDELATSVGVELLTGSMDASERRRVLGRIGSGQAGIVVGTVSILADAVAFADLGLIVIDEQHRFGVEQRATIQARSECPPHMLVMTATPIPRTVAMTVYGDLAVSILDGAPAGRQPIQTTIVPLATQPSWLTRLWQRCREEVERGGQVFVVCPRVGDDDGDSTVDDGDSEVVSTVVDITRELLTGPLEDLRVRSLHGRQDAITKDDVMRGFAAGAVDVLVSTTVVEVGVNVPNATVMVIMDADRFGISQLHQLRGRVGRGEHSGLCLLVTSAQEGSASHDRLSSVASTLDGYELAMADLKARREGNILGASQSGRSALKLLDLTKHTRLIKDARADATALVDQDVALIAHPRVREMLNEALGPEEREFLTRG